MTTNTKIQVSGENQRLQHLHDIWFGQRKEETRGNTDQK